MVPSPLKVSLAAGLLLSVAMPVLGQAPVLRSANHDYRVVTVADGLISTRRAADIYGQQA